MKRALLAVRDYLLGVDLLLLLLCALSAAAGIFLVRSATLTTGSERFVMIQTGAAAIGVIVFIVASLLPEGAFNVIHWVSLDPDIATVNSAGVRLWRDLGCSRVILARELTIL